MKYFAAALFLSLAGSACGVEADVAERFCLSPRQITPMNGLGNFRFDGRVLTARADGAYGYAVIAEDQGGASWAQAGGIVRGRGGRIAFGVSNISNYPLIFRVHRIADSSTFDDVRDASLVGEAMDSNLLERVVKLGAPFECTFALDGNRDLGVPVTSNHQCRCP